MTRVCHKLRILISLTLGVFLMAMPVGAQGTSATAAPGSGQIFATSTPQQANTTPAVVIGPYEYPDGFNPMTGLPYPSQEARARRNLIVKISNHPPLVRPQHGVNAADIVYEYEAEGGVTRFAAIYRTNSPGKVGSIRSGRLMDIELITMYSALLAYSGTSKPIRNIYFSSDFRYRLITPSIGDNCENAGFCRDNTLTDRSYEHKLFGDTNKMWDVATKRNVNTGFRAVGFAFSDESAVGGIAARDVFITGYGRTNARWQYEESSGHYERYTEGVPHFDAADNQQLWADNLVVIGVPHNRRPDIFAPGSADESLEVALWDSGRAYVFRDGALNVGFWKRLGNRPGEALLLMLGNSRPILLKPGRTWITVARSLGNTIVNAELQELPTATPQS